MRILNRAAAEYAVRRMPGSCLGDTIPLEHRIGCARLLQSYGSALGTCATLSSPAELRELKAMTATEIRQRTAASLAQLFAGLQDPASYPHPVQRVEVVHTHFSCV